MVIRISLDTEFSDIGHRRSDVDCSTARNCHRDARAAANADEINVALLAFSLKFLGSTAKQVVAIYHRDRSLRSWAPRRSRIFGWHTRIPNPVRSCPDLSSPARFSGTARRL
jgi:hypothetical protein